MTSAQLHPLVAGRAEADAMCPRCKGHGWHWRTPEGFNPFAAGGWATSRAMFKTICACRRIKPEPPVVQHPLVGQT